jgi:hypothetical protein
MSSTFEFNYDRRNESDIDKTVPKLKGEINWATWEHRLYMALKENNKAYIRIIQEENTRPTRPDYLDVSEEAIRQLAIVKAGGNEDLVTDLVVKEMKKERQHENTRLRAEWQKELDKWDLCNTRACNLIFSTLDTIPASHVSKVENARELYKILYAEYGKPSWQTNFKRFETLCNLQYKGNNPQDFVRKFKEALFEITQRGSKLDANTQLNFFVRAIQNNPRCEVFIHSLKPDLGSTNFMTEVYHEFILTEGSAKIASGRSASNPTPSANTTSSSNSSLNPNLDKKKDKKGGNEKSGPNKKEPNYDLNISGLLPQDRDRETQSPSDRHIPIDFLNADSGEFSERFENAFTDQRQDRSPSPYRPRFSTPPPPTIENDLDEDLFAPASPPLDANHPSVLEFTPPETRPLPDPDSFDLLDDDDDEMAGSLGRSVEAQREEQGAHFEAGGRETPVESQLPSLAAVHEDISQDFIPREDISPDFIPQDLDYSHLDPVPDDTDGDRDFIPTFQAQGNRDLRRSTRIRKPSQAYLDSIASRSFFDANVLQFLSDSPEALVEYFTAATSKDQCTPSKLTPNDVGFEPNSWKEAMSCLEKEKWQVAAHKELHRQIINGTWRIIDRPKRGRKPLTLRWVFKVKHDGTYKARLMARGFRQIKDLDFHEIYAVVAKPMSFKIFTAIAAAKGWFLHHVDIMTAFLYAELKEPIEIELPEIQREEFPGKIGLLIKTIYGLKQSPREWYQLLNDVLISIGFLRTQSDHSIFIKREHRKREHAKREHGKREHGKSPLYVMIYVDDLLILSPSEDEIAAFKRAISKHFDTSDKGLIKRYLAIDVYHDHDTGVIRLSQSDYDEKILTRFGLENCKPVLTPMDEKQKLIPFDGTASKAEIKDFQTRIGTLIWLMVSTRPDISFVVIKLARHAKNPGESHFQALKRVFRYLTGSKHLAISFSPGKDPLHGYCDADWAGPYSEKGLSTSGFIFKMSGGAISWTSKKQPCVALSTTESEYIAEALTTQEAIWLTQLLTEIGIPGFLEKPVCIYADNNGAIALASNPEFHANTKHIALRFHRLRDEVAAGIVKFVKIPTAEMAADGLTKPLGKIMFKRWILQMGLTVYRS